MKTKIVGALLASTLWCISTFAQLNPAPSSTGNITVNASTCATTNACVVLHMATSNVGYSVTVSGTWTGTLTVEQSGDNQGSWTSATTTTANTLFTSALTPGITDVRVRGSAAMTGTAVVTITASGPATLQQVTGGSSSSPSSVTPPPLATYLASQCAIANLLNCYFTPADTQVANDCNWTAAAVDVNCTAAHFVAGDVGKNLMGAQSFAGDNQGSGSGGQIATTTGVTIASFISSTHITLSAIPANAVASNGGIAWGHFDDTGATAMDAAMQAAASCPLAMLAGGYYYFSKPHFNYVNSVSASGNGCGATGAVAGYTGSNLGTVSLPAGFALEGRQGTAPTSIFLDTSFPNGDACNHSPSAGGGSPACFAIPALGKWSNILMTCGNQTVASNMSGKTYLSMSIGTLENFTGMNCDWSGTSVGMLIGTLSQLYQVNNAGFGGTALALPGSTAYASAFRLIVENSATNALTLNAANAPGVPSLTCYWCIFDMPKNGISNKPVIINNGGNLLLYGGTVQPANLIGTSNTGMTAYKCTGTGGNLFADGVNFNFTVGGSSDNGIWLNAQNCTASITNSYISSNQATSAVINDNGSTSGTKLFSLGGNTWIGPVNPPSAGIGLFFSPTDNLTGLTTFSPSCAATTGGTACNILAGGTNEKGTMRITASAVATGTVTLTFLGTFAGPTGAAPRCTTAYVNGGGTGAWSLTATTPIVQTVRSTTVPVFNWNQTGALTAASTYDIDYACTAM